MRLLSPFSLLACPLDGEILQNDGTSLRCAAGHCFDLDRKGTVNLLPVQFRKSLEPGDSAEMVQARRLVLDSGLYQPIAEKLVAVATPFLGRDSAFLDAGCGEGYYTAHLLNNLIQKDSVRALGLDISKYAIRTAASRSKDIGWVVGTNARLPIQDQTLDAVICLFGFPVWAEFHRVLKRGGVVICVDPAKDHLIDIRRHLYKDIKENEKQHACPEGFTALDETRLTVAVPPPSPAVLHDLIMMTPHGYRSTADAIAAATRARYDAITLDVRYTVFRSE